MSLKIREGRHEGSSSSPGAPRLARLGDSSQQSSNRASPSTCIQRAGQTAGRSSKDIKQPPGSLPGLWVTLPGPAATQRAPAQHSATSTPWAGAVPAPPLWGILGGLLAPCCPETTASARLLIAAASGRGSWGDARVPPHIPARGTPQPHGPG